MKSTYNAYAAAHVDGTIKIKNIRCGILDGSGSQGIPLAIVQVSAGEQSHPAYAIERSALKVFAYSEAAKRLAIETIQVNLRANLVSRDEVTMLFSDGEIDFDWHVPSELRQAADVSFAEMISAKTGAIPPKWPATLLSLPISKSSKVLEQ
jgi:hypothetical protein